MRTIVAGLLLCLLTGCTTAPAFRVVDAQSHLPLDGIQGERLEAHTEFSKVPFVLLHSMAPVESQTTSTNGAIAFKQTGSEFMFNPSNKNAAYGSAYVTVGWSGTKIVFPDECREISATPVNGVVEIPLRSRWAVAKEQSQRSIAPPKPDEGRAVLTSANLTDHDSHLNNTEGHSSLR
jgi:hypothetical protein